MLGNTNSKLGNAVSYLRNALSYQSIFYLLNWFDVQMKDINGSGGSQQIIAANDSNFGRNYSLVHSNGTTQYLTISKSNITQFPNKSFWCFTIWQLWCTKHLWYKRPQDNDPAKLHFHTKSRKCLLDLANFWGLLQCFQKLTKLDILVRQHRRNIKNANSAER